METSLECCICLKETNNSKEIFGNISDIDVNIFFHKKLPINSFVVSRCGVHSVCVRCLRNIIFQRNEINRNHPFIRCMSPFRDPSLPKSDIIDTSCVNSIGMPHYFTHSDIKKVLTKKEFFDYLELAEEFQFPGYKIVKCPVNYFHPISKVIVPCKSGIPVDFETIDNSNRGELIIHCDQNIFCQKRFCYHCGSRVFSPECVRCKTLEESKDPLAVNMYFYNPDLNSSKIYLKNKKLTMDIVISQIKEKLEQDILRVRCPRCLVYLIKSDKCNGISHCNIEICYSCGRYSEPRSKLKEHWSEDGSRGCPRFDYSPFWNNKANCEFLCEEEICYSDNFGDCDLETHKQGKVCMTEFRKKAHILHMLKSLLPELRKKVIDSKELEEYKEYIPSLDFIESINTTKLNSMYYPGY